MSQITDAFKGHDLTGWTHCVNNGTQCIVRHAANGDDVCISFNEGRHTFGVWMYGDGYALPPTPTLAEAVRVADDLIAEHGGWAPAPIGYSADPGWRTDWDQYPDYQTVQVSYHFGEGDPTPPMVYRKAQRNKAGVWKVQTGHGWELLHGIVYAWREEPGVDPAPPEAKP